MTIKRYGIQFTRISEGQYVAVHHPTGQGYLVHKTAHHRWEIFPLCVDGPKKRGQDSRLHTGEDEGDHVPFLPPDGWYPPVPKRVASKAKGKDGRPKVLTHQRHSGYQAAGCVNRFEAARLWISARHAEEFFDEYAPDGEQDNPVK